MILIIDFGSQTTHLIGRRLQEIGVAYKIGNPHSAMNMIKERAVKGVILSGGPASVYLPDAPHLDQKIFSFPIPFLGICYGWQLMAYLLGGRVEHSAAEYGPQTLFYHEDLFNLKRKAATVFMSHGDTVTNLPHGFFPFASTTHIRYAAVTSAEKRLWGVQFHPEVEHTEGGKEILKQFALNICSIKAKKTKLDPNKITDAIRETVRDDEVICAVSGGVDSTVCAYLIATAIGKNLHPIYIDNGLMRPDTRERVQKIFNDLIIVDGEELFLKTLKGMKDPEGKRKAIGRLYIELFNREAQKMPKVKYLAQGTIYSDIIESKEIKSHHNVGGLPDELPFKLLEPLRHYYKDQVRELGRLVGLSEALIGQHPFPGPGYAIRIRGEVTAQRLSQVKQADAIIMEEVEKKGFKNQLFQCFAVMTGAYSTAVKGDRRAFAEVVALRAYMSIDVMTAQWAKLPYELLQTISNRLVNEIPEVSRVVYDITPKPPATMEWE